MKLLLVCLGALFLWCEGYKILVVFPMPTRSHGILGDGIVRHLLNDGHHVTYFSAFSYKNDTNNLRVINVSPKSKPIPADMMSIESIMNKKTNRIEDHGMLIAMITELFKSTIEILDVQTILNDPKEQFDAVIVEWIFSELPAGFAAVFNCPLIWFSSVDVHWMILRLIDQTLNPAYSADFMHTIIPPFNFWQRTAELYTQLKVQLLRYLYYDGLERKYFEDLLAPVIAKRGRQAPSFFDVQYNASLVLGNSHESVGQAVGHPANYKPIAGYHVQEDEPLPNDLKTIMDNARNGVIYFSMGSNLKSKNMPKKIKDDLLKMFGELKQTVLWKFEDDLPNIPSNVYVIKWAPQTSMLAHPNTVLFITHCGLLSATETLHFGVPIIGIPVFGDQFVNTDRAVKKGYGMRVDLSYNMAVELKLAVEEITSNTKYAKRAKDWSVIYHDRPTTPGKELQHWVRHVIEIGGAPHLRSPAISVPFYQKLYLDLLAIILVILFIFISLLKCIWIMCSDTIRITSFKKLN